MTNLEKLLQYIKGTIFAILIDISKWQEWFDLDVAELLKVIDGVMIRAGHGSVKDIRFEEFYRELEDHPDKLRGAYWFFVSYLPWELQLEMFLATIEGKDFDWICLDVEENVVSDTVAAGYSLTGIRFLKRLQEAYPSKRVMVYSRKYVYERLRQFSAEWDNWPYHHAQYWWTNWYNLTQYFLDYWKVVFTTGRKPTLPASRTSCKLQQIGDKTNLGKEFGVGSSNVDINVSMDSEEDFIAWIGKPARWSDDADEPPITVEPPIIDDDITDEPPITFPYTVDAVTEKGTPVKITIDVEET